MKTHDEAQRQQALMAALLRRIDDRSGDEQGGDEQSLATTLAQRPAGMLRGLQVYQANAGAAAERALSAAFPTVRALMGEESFAALARAYWQARPPERGDLAWLGAHLPAFIADSDQLADVPYLADVAQLDGWLAEAERAADAELEPTTLALLTGAEPATFTLSLMPGTRVLTSMYPVVSLWKAHQADEDAELQRGKVRTALAAGRGEIAVVSRAGWRGRVTEIDAATARWMHSLLRGEALALALAAAGDGFNLEDWLLRALQAQWLWRAKLVA